MPQCVDFLEYVCAGDWFRGIIPEMFTRQKVNATLNIGQRNTATLEGTVSGFDLTEQIQPPRVIDRLKHVQPEEVEYLAFLHFPWAQTHICYVDR